MPDNRPTPCATPLPPPMPLPLRWRLAALMVVLFALFSALYVARAVMLPLALAMVLSFLLSPITRALSRLGLPSPISAAMVVLLLLAALVVAAFALVDPATQWLERLPELVRRMEQRLEVIAQSLSRFGRLVEPLESAAGIGEGEVQLAGSGLREILLARTWRLGAGAAMLVFLLYFLLASGDTFLRKLVRVLPRMREKRMAVAVARHIQADVSRYLFTVAVINTALGLVVGSVMYWLDMPNPMLWGVMAGVLNFIPYLGPAITLTVLASVALITFDDLGTALLRPLTFFAITTVEGQLITPLILGRRLMLNPVVIFVSLIFWGWLWGVTGTLLAVPLTMIIKILCDAVPPLAPVGELMGR